jgi:uncharacterized protein (TIGR03084 family)
MSTYSELVGDLEDEYRDLHRKVAPLAPDAAEWNLPTPAEGWMIRDQISHLAYFDVAAHLAVSEPQKFALMAEALNNYDGDPMEGHLMRGRALDGENLLAWWTRSHEGMMEVLRTADERVRVPWFGLPMGMRSFVSARLMETWAHGQDIADALKIQRVPTHRLRHVAHLAVGARPYSYAARGREVPPARIEVVLEAPSGEEWIWKIGDEAPGGTTGSVRGSAEAFCLVATQRRNVADVALHVEGDAAVEWMSIAQTYAGPPGSGKPAAITDF